MSAVAGGKGRGAGTAQGTAGRPGRKYDSEFVSADLTDAEKALCKVWGEWEVDPDALLESVLGDGLRLTLKDDPATGGFLVFLNPVGDTHPYVGWVLSGRGSTPVKAIKQACFRHLVQLKRKWPLVSKSTARTEFDD